MVDYRDESTFADSLAIVGAGPLGGYTASMVVQNADGYRYVVAPMVDGFTWQGLQINGNLNITKYQPGMGLRLVIGTDPANPSTDYFSLGQGTPQVWTPNNYAAGVALCEMRIVNHSNRTGSCLGLRAGWAGGRRGADIVPESDRSRSAGPAANGVLVDIRAGKPAVSSRREPGDSRTTCLDGQNTAECCKIPGKDGGRTKKTLSGDAGLQPAGKSEQTMLEPSSERGRIGAAGRVVTVRGRSLQRLAGRDALARQLAAAHTERRRWRLPARQNCEGDPAGRTDAAPHPDQGVPVVMTLPEPPAMPDDFLAPAHRALPR